MKDEPAYPTYGIELSELDGSYSLSTGSNGLTKREHFAGLAMQGMLANNKCMDEVSANTDIECQAVRWADALIAELSKESE